MPRWIRLSPGIMLLGSALFGACSTDPPPATPAPDPQPPAGMTQDQPPFPVPDFQIPGDPCEYAWKEFSAFAKEIDQLAAGGAKVPEQSSFLETCRLLPAEVQPCMSTQYTLSHRQQCTALWQTVPADVQKEVQQRLAQRKRR